MCVACSKPAISATPLPRRVQQHHEARTQIKSATGRRIDFRNYHDRIITDGVERPTRQPWPLQEEAITDTLHGFENHDRGRLVMACCTGKMFTSLRIAERFVSDGGSILFLAPTIALVSQARREWLTHTARPLNSLVVCSDPYAGGKNEQEDIRISELTCPANPPRGSDRTSLKECTFLSPPPTSPPPPSPSGTPTGSTRTGSPRPA